MKIGDKVRRVNGPYIGEIATVIDVSLDEREIWVRYDKPNLPKNEVYPYCAVEPCNQYHDWQIMLKEEWDNYPINGRKYEVKSLDSLTIAVRFQKLNRKLQVGMKVYNHFGQELEVYMQDKDPNYFWLLAENKVTMCKYDPDGNRILNTSYYGQYTSIDWERTEKGE